MIRFSSRHALLAGGALMLFVASGGQVAAQPGYVPSFQTGPNGWQHRFGGAFPYVSGSASPTMQDPKHIHFNNEMARINNAQPNYRIGDISNPNLKSWAKDAMKKDNDEVLAGKFAFTARSSCAAAGVPGFLVLLAPGGLTILQEPSKVTMIVDGNAETRHIRLNAPHAANVPSWYGDSVGHYEGDTLVIDTIGLNDKTFLDNYRTPHSDKLHVIERWRLIENGAKIEVLISIDDPDTFNAPFKMLRQYERVNRTFAEYICAENNSANIFDYGTPTAERPDF
jgi:hypothetical protein